MKVTIRTTAQMLAGVVAASACVVACTNSVDGTPLADPNATTFATPTRTPSTPAPTTRAPSTSPRPGAPTVPPVPTRTAVPGAPTADVTCDEYMELDEDAQREVITAIGEENELVAINPELWITVTSALCTFAEPTTPVREVLEGQGIR